MMKERKKQYIVVGLGRFGKSVATSLCEFGHEVLAIDMDDAAVEETAPFVTQTVKMNATDKAALETLGVRNFDAAIITIGMDLRDSILICMLLKEMGVPCVIAKAIDDLHATVLRKVGADRVIFPERDMGVRLAKSLVSPNVLELVNMADDYQLIEIYTPAKWVNQSIEEVEVRRKYGVTILALYREKELIPSPDAKVRFKAQDLLLLLGKKEDMNHINDLGD